MFFKKKPSPVWTEDDQKNWAETFKKAKEEIQKKEAEIAALSDNQLMMRALAYCLDPEYGYNASLRREDLRKELIKRAK